MKQQIKILNEEKNEEYFLGAFKYVDECEDYNNIWTDTIENLDLFKKLINNNKIFSYLYYIMMDKNLTDKLTNELLFNILKKIIDKNSEEIYDILNKDLFYFSSWKNQPIQKIDKKRIFKILKNNYIEIFINIDDYDKLKILEKEYNNEIDSYNFINKLEKNELKSCEFYN